MIRTFQPVTGIDLHDGYCYFDVWYNANAKINGIPCRIEINGGSFLYLFSGDTSYILGDEKKQLRRYFMTTAWAECDVSKD